MIKKKLYDDFFVSKVVEAYDKANDTKYCEQVENNYRPKKGEKCFYSVYGHLIEGCCDCIADFKYRPRAEHICKILNQGLKNEKL